jgi:hypothetical protein
MHFTRTGNLSTDQRTSRRRFARRTAALVLPAGLVVFATACFDEEGSGDLVTYGYDDFSDPEITGISVLDDMDVHVTVDPDASQSAQVRIDDNLVNNGYADIDDGTLTIAFDGLGEIEPSETPVVELTVNSIEVIENHSDGDVTVIGVRADSLDVVNSESGTVTVRGAADSVELSSSGSGSVDLAQLVAGSVEFDDTDDGDVAVRAIDTVAGAISGDAAVVVHGDPATTDVEVDDDAELDVA